jgi:hypothetical protein
MIVYMLQYKFNLYVNEDVINFNKILAMLFVGIQCLQMDERDCNSLSSSLASSPVTSLFNFLSWSLKDQ